jgi:hypothetical protein
VLECGLGQTHYGGNWGSVTVLVTFDVAHIQKCSHLQGETAIGRFGAITPGCPLAPVRFHPSRRSDVTIRGI